MEVTSNAIAKEFDAIDMKGLEDYVQSYMSNYHDTSHDWSHILRVRNMANYLVTIENQNETSYNTINQSIVDLSALLHDIGDSKYLKDGHTVEDELRSCMNQYNVSKSIQDIIVWIVPRISYSYEVQHSFDDSAIYSKELACVQDSDRLDAIGAIGIARCFSFNGKRNLSLYNPLIKPLPQEEINSGSYKEQKNKGNARNHFYEKLLLLSKMMKTKTGKIESLKRQDMLELFIKQFDIECNLTECH